MATSAIYAQRPEACYVSIREATTRRETGIRPAASGGSLKVL